MNANKKSSLHLKILYLEDSTFDAELVLEYLRDASIYAIQMQVVANKSEYLAALSTNKFDIILSDFALPDFDGFAALSLAKSLCPKTPFICVSGSIGEETAVELLKQGTADYALKDNLGRLTNSIERAMTTAKNLEKLHKAQTAIANSEARHKEMIANISDVISIVNFSGMITYTSPNIKKLFGWSPHELKGKHAWEKIHPAELAEFKKEFYTVLQKNALVSTAEYKLENKDGSYSYIQLTATNLLHNTHIKGILLNYHDISKLKNREHEILHISYHDFLTGLYNRLFFEEEIKRLDTARQLPISIIMGDINGLKLINDAFGHTKGDEVLIEIANILRKCCREEDIIARIGGDEFGIVMPQTNPETAELVCNRIYNTCKKYCLDKSNICPSISLGHATKSAEEESIDLVFRNAEEFMTKHKLLESKSTHSSIIASIKTTMFEKSQETEEHAERLVLMSKRLGETMSLTEDQLSDLELLSTLHDIGKMSIDRNILDKAGKLTEEEWIEMKKHPEVGYRIAQATSELIPIAKYILCHHERWDGTGYPQGLRGEEIPLLSRILTVVDSYDAMTSRRTYRTAFSKEEAIAEIIGNLGTQFDPKIGKIFTEIIANTPINL
ncbi:MAG: HD domain-containing phosphohydrolase [Clostridia bacterium]